MDDKKVLFHLYQTKKYNQTRKEIVIHSNVGYILYIPKDANSLIPSFVSDAEFLYDI